MTSTDITINWVAVHDGVPIVDVAPYRATDCYGDDWLVTGWEHDFVTYALGCKIRKDGQPSKRGQQITGMPVPQVILDAIAQAQA